MSIGSKSVPISPLVDIYSWSKSRPEWQRDALRRIVTQGSLKDADLDELEQICRHGRSALEKDEVPPIVIPLDAEHLPTTSAHGNGISLVSLSQVINVNRLPDDQTLSFQPGSSLTVIYGKNGAAKIRLCTHYRKKHADAVVRPDHFCPTSALLPRLRRQVPAWLSKKAANTTRLVGQMANLQMIASVESSSSMRTVPTTISTKATGRRSRHSAWISSKSLAAHPMP